VHRHAYVNILMAYMTSPFEILFTCVISSLIYSQVFLRVYTETIKPVFKTSFESQFPYDPTELLVYALMG